MNPNIVPEIPPVTTKDKVKLALYEVYKGSFPKNTIKSDSFQNFAAGILNTGGTLTMATFGYLLDLRYIELTPDEGFIITKDPQKRVEIDALLKTMTDSEVRRIKAENLK